MDRAGDILKRVLNQKGLLKEAQASMVVVKADEWVQARLPAVASHIHTDKLQDGVLLMACDNSIAAQECQQGSAGLLSYLAQECPTVSIREIRTLRS